MTRKLQSRAPSTGINGHTAMSTILDVDDLTIGFGDAPPAVNNGS